MRTSLSVPKKQANNYVILSWAGGNTLDNNYLEYMTRSDFNKLGQEWVRKNIEYDGYVQELIDNPQRGYTSTNISYLEKLQKDLFDLETELLKVASGEEILED